MTTKRFIYFFLFWGFLFAAICIYFTYQDASTKSGQFNEAITMSSTNNSNMGLGAIAMGIISASCLIISGFLINKNSD